MLENILTVAEANNEVIILKVKDNLSNLDIARNPLAQSNYDYFSLIRGKDIDEALAIAKYAPKASSEIIEKLLKSAIANAENNHHMAHEKLYVAEIYANQGPTLKRIRPAAKGSAVRIRKRTSHITIVLKELN